MKIAIIAILDQANGIGRDNKLLCHLPADLRRFKHLTTGHSIIMGRKTFESLPNGPLPDRQNIILTRDNNFKAPDCTIVHSVNEAFYQCDDPEKVFVIGGEQIYRLLLQIADILHITKVNFTFKADSFFPEIKEEEWEIIEKTDYKADEKNKYDYSFIEFSRKNNNF